LPLKFENTPRRFHELQYTRESLTIDKTYDKERLKILFEKDRFIIKDNRTFFIFDYSHADDIMPLLSWCEKEELGFSFLRLCLSHELCCVIPENLERIPILMNSKLPQFEFEKNAENDDLDDQPAIMTAAQIKPFEILKSNTSMESFNEEFKLEPEVVLANFNKFLVSLKWTNNHPKNFKEWFISIVDDCFYFYLKMNEPVYAYHLLKISMSFMQNFLYKIDKDEIEIDEDAEFNPAENTLEKCLEKLGGGEDFVKTNYKCHHANVEFEETEWGLKFFNNTNIKIEGNKFISFHK